jgi:hypothetical protein
MPKISTSHFLAARAACEGVPLGSGSSVAIGWQIWLSGNGRPPSSRTWRRLPVEPFRGWSVRCWTNTDAAAREYVAVLPAVRVGLCPVAWE